MRSYEDCNEYSGKIETLKNEVAQEKEKYKKYKMKYTNILQEEKLIRNDFVEVMDEYQEFKIKIRDHKHIIQTVRKNAAERKASVSG